MRKVITIGYVRRGQVEYREGFVVTLRKFFYKSEKYEDFRWKTSF